MAVNMTSKAYFTCIDCKMSKPVLNNKGKQAPHNGFASSPDGPICLECATEREKKQMRETGKISLYLIFNRNGHWTVNNWIGSLRFPVIKFSQSNHNIAGKNARSDVWFVFEDHIWHGVNIGDNEVCRCRETKQKG